MTLEQGVFGRIGERVLYKPGVDEWLARKRVVSDYTLEALGEVQTGDIYQIRDAIFARHKTKATPKEVWQALVELQLEDVHIECETVVGTDGNGKPKARFLWSRKEGDYAKTRD